MKVQSINCYQQHLSHARKNVEKMKSLESKTNASVDDNQVAFKGAKGGALGVIAGATVGALGAAAIITTGGLAGIVAAVGYGSTVAAGAASCTHLGGIAGSIIEDKLDNEDK